MCFRSHDNEDVVPPRPVHAPATTSDAKAPYRPPQPPQYSAASGSGQPFSSAEASDYAPPTGPPPSGTPAPATGYEAPPGPPPSHAVAVASGDDYAPPPGPPPQHDWQTAVPDTSLFPPPPALFSGWDRSPANNATEQEATAGEDWCRQHPLAATPLALQGDDGINTRQALAAHKISLMQPAGFHGTLEWPQLGLWRGHTQRDAPDTCILGYPPLYAPSLHNPLVTGRPHTAYYEVAILRDNTSREEVTLALGLAALPYPAFRLPGWHRGSLAVHGDDGHRYINDLWGGKSCTKPFRRGEVYGLGLRFAAAAGGHGIEVEVFLTRNGTVDQRWNLHEETDAEQDRPVFGLEGYHDLSIAIGTFDEVHFEVRFDPTLWAYRGE